jgi:hypothetical protein
MTEGNSLIKAIASSPPIPTQTRRGPTSMFIDRALWAQVRKAAVDLGITATEFVEVALKEELTKVYTKENE